MSVKSILAGVGLVLVLFGVAFAITIWQAVSRLNPAPPDRLIEPEIVGVVTQQRQGSVPVSRIYVVNGQDVEIHPGEDIELAGPGPGEGRLLLVARDGDNTYHLSLVADEQGTARGCYSFHRRGFVTDEGVTFSFSPTDGEHFGLLLVAGPEYEPSDVIEESGLIMSEHTFCVTADGRVHAPDFVPSS